jgi:DNA-binding response OmpR family regulator
MSHGSNETNAHSNTAALANASKSAGPIDMSFAPRASLNGVNVLVVEDSWHVASAIKSVVENAGMEVVALAATVADAEVMLALHEPQIAVVDINLHGEEAYGFIEQLFALGIPVVIISGYEVLPAFTARAAAILKKPIRASVLLATLQRIEGERNRH